MFLAWKEIKRNKIRFMMIGFILVLIAWLVFILAGLGNGLSSLSASTFKHFDVSYVVFEEGAKNSMLRSTVSTDAIKELKQFEQVKQVEGIGYVPATLLKGTSKATEEKTAIALLGVDPDGFLVPSVTEGKNLSTNTPNGVLANDTLKKLGYVIGDTLSLEGTTSFVTIVGFVHGETFSHVPSVFIPIDTWRTIKYNAPGSDRGIANPVNALMVQADALNMDEVNEHLDHLEIVTKKDGVNGLPGYKEENATIMLMVAFCIAISAVVIAVFFYVLTLQKSNQLGIMKALGASDSFLTKMIVSQIFVIASVSILLGIGITYLCTFVFPANMPFDLSVQLVVVYSLVLLGISMAASWLSVRVVTKIDPLHAIGRVD